MKKYFTNNLKSADAIDSTKLAKTVEENRLKAHFHLQLLKEERNLPWLCPQYKTNFPPLQDNKDYTPSPSTKIFPITNQESILKTQQNLINQLNKITLFSKWKALKLDREKCTKNCKQN